MPPPSMEANSVLARAEDAIRRARRLTTAYSDLWAEEQRAAEEEARRTSPSPSPSPSQSAAPLVAEDDGGADNSLPSHLASERSDPPRTITASTATDGPAPLNVDRLASMYSQSLLEAYMRGRASGSSSSGRVTSSAADHLTGVSGDSGLTAGLPRVSALLSALMRARMQQQDAERGVVSGSSVAGAAAQEPPTRSTAQVDSGRASGEPGEWNRGGGTPGATCSALQAEADAGNSAETEPWSQDGAAGVISGRTGPTDSGAGEDGRDTAEVETEAGVVCGSKVVGRSRGDGGSRTDMDMEDLEQEDELPEDQMQPIFAVAQRLAALQRQQSDTLQQLLRLRLEQLRLRQQQLAALQCLLRTEAACIEGSPLQLSAVQQAVDLLTDSLEDVHAAAAALQWGGEITHAAAVAASVSEADSRAEEVSMMARQLLSALRRHPNRVAGGTSGPVPLRGATPEEIAQFPVEQCIAGCALQGETCSICLSSFHVGDDMRGLRCPSARTRHFFHKACIDEWLGIRGCCPLCKYEILVDE
eukprot:CAMPEP_0177784964 /NCGR_PEP_ID=MMETSP0491_2-20121128/20022_1 /TAXON_ID=63592 /ORGANISM="Tetraselmis chuii, Strain PLY429" /LENGTH=530 /DNA_ID=CAMNT_0019305847 /DNA_START=169 /DNA_END=1761 /DNA_ORIENTATION=+